ncbi:MAG TPA: hypothetical protein VF576_10120 [Rubricoccaceae bacterium]|jgi:hypothetical protein
MARPAGRVYVHGVTSAICDGDEAVGLARVARDAAMREHSFQG